MKILQIVQRITGGGGVTGMISVAEELKKLGNYHQTIVSLIPSDPAALEIAQEADLRVVDNPDKTLLFKEIDQADIVQINYWNTPEIFELIKKELPPMRLTIRFNVNGVFPPHIILPEMIDYCDFAVASSPYSYEQDFFQSISPEIKFKKTTMIYGTADFQKFQHISPVKNDTFNIGYIGMVNFVKLHRRFIEMSAGINIPDARFIVAGHGGAQPVLQKEAKEFGISDRIEFLGFQNNLVPLLNRLDVFGYPLCKENYSTAERILQEVLFAGIPPVVFAHGGAQRTIQHNYTGYVVSSEIEYQQAIEYLYHHPKERDRLGRNAKNYALSLFGTDKAAEATHLLYERIMKTQKRQRGRFVPLRTYPDTGNAGAQSFIDSLGKAASQFISSLCSKNEDSIIRAEQQIAESTPVLCSIGGGGIFHYKNKYPKDPFLRLWAGLVFENQNKIEDAVREYEAAISNGLKHKRIYNYLARAQKMMPN